MKKFNCIVPLLVFFAAFILIVSCGTSFNKASYRGLGTMAVSYDVAMKSAADLHARGFISEEGKDMIVKAANDYAQAHNAAVQSFQDYLNAPPEMKETAQQKAALAMASSLKFYSALLDILTKNGVYGEPVEPWF